MCHYSIKHRSDKHHSGGFRRQQGAALLMSMVFLMILTLLSVSAMKNSMLETKIAANHQHKMLSFQSQESAFARLLGPDPEVSRPLTIAAAPTMNSNYFVSSGVTNQPDLSADVRMDFVEKSTPGQYKYSGYGLNIVTLKFNADAFGKVDNSGAKTHGRMQVALIRD